MKGKRTVILIPTLLCASIVSSESWDEGLVPVPPLCPPAAFASLDPNSAPLPLLSRLPGVGRAGAVRIGKSRKLEPVRSFQDLKPMMENPEALEEASFRFQGGSRMKVGFRERVEWKREGRREMHSVEAARGRMEAGGMIERDPGEREWADFRSWSCAWRSGRGRSRIVAGDMAVRLGSGLLVGTGESFGYPSGFSKFRGSRLSRYRSRMESGAHRGVGVLFPLPAGRGIALLTSTYRDARVDDGGLVSSIDRAGYHRTVSETARKDALSEKIGAFRWEVGGERVETGWTTATAQFNPPLGGGDLSRKPNAFRGGRLSALSADFRLTLDKTILQGEIGTSTSGGAAGRFLARFSGANRSGIIRFRNFSGRFHAPRGVVYHRIGSEPSGERGWISALEERFGSSMRAGVWFHRYQSFGRTWNSSGPVFGSEWSVKIQANHGPLSTWVRGGATKRSEVRHGKRTLGESASAAGGFLWNPSGPLRLRFDLKGAAARSPGEEETRLGAGGSLLIRLPVRSRGSTSFSWTVLSMDEVTLGFPAPHLPGSMPVAWFGRGRGGSGFSFLWEGRLPGGWSGALLLGRGSCALETGMTFGSGRSAGRASSSS